MASRACTTAWVCKVTSFGGGAAVIMTVRPHMAGILAIAFIFPHLFGANRTG